MFRILFKIKRRLAIAFHEWKRKGYLFEQRSLYPGRFRMDGTLRFGKRFSVIFDASTSVVAAGTNLHFRDDCQIRSGSHGKLSIGDHVFFNNHCSIHCFHEITIGDNSQFGENVRIYDVNHQFKDRTKLISEQGYSEGAIHIGSNCWIGSNTVILKNVTIGDNTVIGANCVIYQSIPPGCLVLNRQQLDIKPL